MSSCPELLDGVGPEEHVVQLYGTDNRLLTRNVARYLSVGLRRGDGLLVIAASEHRSTIARLLREEAGYSKAVLEGRLVFLDARATLARFMVAGSPDPELFQSVIGEALQGVRSRGVHTGVRAYGEMVGLLWKEGERAAAVRLEELWNNLLRRSDASLFCGYPIDIFGSDFEPDTVDPILCTHTHLLPLDQALEHALNQAMDDVLGPRVEDIRRLIRSNHRPSWGTVPRPEAVVLWIRNNLAGSAGEILARARELYRPLEPPADQKRLA